MDVDDKQELFDGWAASYDGDVDGQTGFPFEGYDRVLARVIDLAGPRPGVTLLELGPGTGNLTAQLLARGADVWAVDFAAEMLARARAKAPAAHFAQAHLLAAYPADFRRPYDAIVATYVFHELPAADKLRLLRRLADDYLRPGGVIAIGDVGFADTAARDAVRAAAGDDWDDEFFWIMSEDGPALAAAGFAVEVEQLSVCGLALAIRPAT
ncbi:MAG: class I SAM-dependent methyltransferase [Candidatus Promineofilum sp.]|nr:class I SAM-dependent methyltransferase [Promineifilum sp.]MCW5862960.1 class I SAM-dependent methyltransferase [Anaerolineae bacterium]